MIENHSARKIALIWVVVTALMLLPPLGSGAHGVIKGESMRYIFQVSFVLLLVPLVYALYRRHHANITALMLGGAVTGQIIGTIAAALCVELAPTGVGDTTRAAVLFGAESVLLSYAWVSFISCTWLAGAIAALFAKLLYYRDESASRRARINNPAGSPGLS